MVVQDAVSQDLFECMSVPARSGVYITHVLWEGERKDQECSERRGEDGDLIQQSWVEEI
jgi:hypothetical protein